MPYPRGSPDGFGYRVTTNALMLGGLEAEPQTAVTLDIHYQRWVAP